MKPRLIVPLASLGLIFGSMLMAATTASAATPHAIRPHITHAGFTPGGLMSRPTTGAHIATVGGRTTAESTNWSGYAVTGANGHFTSVSASWTEPSATCTSRTDQYAAFWVGLDGYSSDSVEQTGSDSDCVGKNDPSYYGWYEMYPADPVYFSNTVKSGDAMSASVTFSGTETYTLVLKDSTQGWTQTITKNESGFDRSSAEVITEAPCCTNSGGILPLSDFGTVNYSTSSANGTSLGTQSPIQIVMINNSGQDKDSTSSISSGGAFSNTWIRAS
jgi:hypothetical protein